MAIVAVSTLEQTTDYWQELPSAETLMTMWTDRVGACVEIKKSGTLAKCNPKTGPATAHNKVKHLDDE